MPSLIKSTGSRKEVFDGGSYNLNTEEKIFLA